MTPSITLVACRRIEVGVNEYSRNGSLDARRSWGHDIQITGNHRVPKRVDKLILVV